MNERYAHEQRFPDDLMSPSDSDPCDLPPHLIAQLISKENDKCWAPYGTFSPVLVFHLLFFNFGSSHMCCVRKPMMRYKLKYIESRTSLDCSYGYQKHKFVNFLVEYIGPPNWLCSLLTME